MATGGRQAVSKNQTVKAPGRPDNPVHQSYHTRQTAKIKLNAPAHMQAGACTRVRKTKRAHARRYSLGVSARLRVRERRIFLGIKNFFPTSTGGRGKSRGVQKKNKRIYEQIVNNREVAHYVPVFKV